MNIYVGNLNYTVDENLLAQTFSPYGSVESAKLIMDKMSGRSKGFGFVEIADDAAGQQAIDALNDSDLMGRKMVVNQARPKS